VSRFKRLPVEAGIGPEPWGTPKVSPTRLADGHRILFFIIIIIIIIIIINCNWVITRWQWLFYMYTEYEIGY